MDTLEKGSNHDFLLLFPSVSDEVSSLPSLDHRGGESLATSRLDCMKTDICNKYRALIYSRLY